MKRNVINYLNRLKLQMNASKHLMAEYIQVLTLKEHRF